MSGVVLLLPCQNLFAWLDSWRTWYLDFHADQIPQWDESKLKLNQTWLGVLFAFSASHPLTAVSRTVAHEALPNNERTDTPPTAHKKGVRVLSRP